MLSAVEPRSLAVCWCSDVLEPSLQRLYTHSRLANMFDFGVICAPPPPHLLYIVTLDPPPPPPPPTTPNPKNYPTQPPTYPLAQLPISHPTALPLATHPHTQTTHPPTHIQSTNHRSIHPLFMVVVLIPINWVTHLLNKHPSINVPINDQ